MANPNFYNQNNFAFQRGYMPPNFIPPPPPPPRFYLRPAPSISDADFVKQFEKPSTNKQNVPSSVSITQVREQLRNIVIILKELKDKEKSLTDNIESLSEEEWNANLCLVDENKQKIDKTLALLNDSCLEDMRKLLAKRSAKRMRLKRLKNERKRERDEAIKEREERSRKIDENLQKIKDDILKAKQEEEAKLQADSILRGVLRRKQDARKCVTELDALLKLYRARQNTARGRGTALVETDAAALNSDIGKLKSLWERKLASYEEEERELRAKLSRDSAKPLSKPEDCVLKNLKKWRKFLFGTVGEPQFDFKGDVSGFLAVRAQWDQYINGEGSSLPIGWVVP